MSHNLAQDADNKKGKKKTGYAFVSVIDDSGSRPAPWHGLGTSVAEAMRSADCCKLAKLNYTVEKVPLHWYYGAGTKKASKGISDRMAEVVRTDSGISLGTVGANFEVVQNVQAFEFLDSLIGPGADKLGMYETAGALGNGEKIFITLKLPKQTRVGKDDMLENYLFLYMGHNSMTPITVAFTPIRIVCNNTLNMALANCNHKIVIKHTKNVQEKFALAQRVLGMTNNVDRILTPILNRMAEVKITDTQLREYIAAVMSPNKEIITQEQWDSKGMSTRVIHLTEEIFEYAVSNPTQMTGATKGTVYGALNAITGYYQNMKEWESAEEKIDNLIISQTGTGKMRTEKAFEMAMRYIQN
jgi:phage/plasmid-like protein (TIGR03299 family)